MVTLVLAGIGIAGVRSGDGTDQLSSGDPARSADPRADRGDRPTPSASPTPSPSVSLADPQLRTAAPPAPATTKPAPPPAPRKTTPAPTPSTPRRAPTPSPTPAEESCGASFYDQGETTANGEPFDPNGLTAAHKTFPFNTRVRVTNPANGKSVTVRINDRGPFVEDRCLDLARGAFERIASLSSGVITVRYQVL